MPASVALGFGGKMPSLTGRMRKSLLGDLSRHRDLYCIRFSKEHSLAGRNDSVEGESTPADPSHARIDSLHPAGDILSCAYGWDHEMPHTNGSLFCLALGNDASPVAAKLKLLWVGLLSSVLAVLTEIALLFQSSAQFCKSYEDTRDA